MVNERLIAHVERELENTRIDLRRQKLAVKELTSREKELAAQLAEMKKQRKDDDADGETTER